MHTQAVIPLHHPFLQYLIRAYNFYSSFFFSFSVLLPLCLSAVIIEFYLPLCHCVIIFYWIVKAKTTNEKEEIEFISRANNITRIITELGVSVRRYAAQYHEYIDSYQHMFTTIHCTTTTTYIHLIKPAVHHVLIHVYRFLPLLDPRYPLPTFL